MYITAEDKVERVSVCPNCGREFNIYCRVDDWAYKLYDKPYCRWNCLQEARRKRGEEKKQNRIARLIEREHARNAR